MHAHSRQFGVVVFLSAGFGLSTLIQLASSQQVAIVPLRGQTVNILLTDKQGGTVKQYIAKLDGLLAVDANRRVTEFSGSIQSLVTADKKSMPVAKSEVRDGTLLMTTKEGAVYQAYDISSNLVGSIRLLKATPPK